MESFGAWVALQRWQEALPALGPANEQMQPDSEEERASGEVGLLPSRKDSGTILGTPAASDTQLGTRASVLEGISWC